MLKVTYLYVYIYTRNLSRIMRKPTFWFSTWSDENQAVQSRKTARDLKFRMYEVEGLYYPCSENKDADQLRGYREADLCLCFRICNVGFSHDAAHLFIYERNNKIHKVRI